MQDRSLGRTRWVIAEGYIPEYSSGPQPAMTSHETMCLLNLAEEAAHVEITLYFPDREPLGGYRILVPPQRTLHVRFNDLKSPQPVPRGVDYASVISSDTPIVVQHTRIDTRQPANALMTTLAWSADS